MNKELLQWARDTYTFRLTRDLSTGRDFSLDEDLKRIEDSLWCTLRTSAADVLWKSFIDD